MFTKSRTHPWRLGARSGAVLITAVAVAASTQAGVISAQASVTGGRPVTNPFALVHKHPYLRDAFPSVPQLRKMRQWARTHRGYPVNSAAPLTYHGGIDGIGVTSTHEMVYLVFYGSQWGTQGTNSHGYLTLSGDPSGEAPYLQKFLKGLGTNHETWSGVATQYCQGVAIGATSCPAGNPAHVAYPYHGALAGVWADESTAAPAQATGHQLAQEAVNAAAHFGNTIPAYNRNAQYVIVSPPGTNPEGLFPAYCGRHDYSTDPFLSGGPVTSPYGDLAFVNLPYVPSQGGNCGAGWVNSPGTLDGVSIVGGHEYTETITDQNLAGGWLDSNGAETGDKCAWIHPGNPGGVADLSVATGTFAVQSMWANDANGGTGGCETSHPIITGPDVITVTNPGPQFNKLGHPVSLQIRASATSGSPVGGYAAAGLPPGLAINSTGLISGTPTQIGTYTVTITAVDRNDTQGSATFTWAVSVF
jgi:serine protease